mmetsp:Transcript_33143/g.93840  ORF Transcript_33143/g.93840 Transcript_33143/m.93840 type:complete len:202 (-) Transcript_33143:77-682(-)
MPANSSTRVKRGVSAWSSQPGRLLFHFAPTRMPGAKCSSPAAIIPCSVASSLPRGAPGAAPSSKTSSGTMEAPAWLRCSASSWELGLASAPEFFTCSALGVVTLVPFLSQASSRSSPRTSWARLLSTSSAPAARPLLVFATRVVASVHPLACRLAAPCNSAPARLGFSAAWIAAGGDWTDPIAARPRCMFLKLPHDLACRQ